MPLSPHPRPSAYTNSGVDIINLFQDLWEKGHTLVLITHDPAIAERAHRTVQMQDGRIVEDSAA